MVKVIHTSGKRKTAIARGTVREGTGKVLSNGELDKKVNVVALKFSAKAQEKIESAGGECISIDEIIETNPKGSNIRIIE